MKSMIMCGLALCCLPLFANAATIVINEGPPATSRAAVPANTVPGDVILCETAMNTSGTDCITRFDRSDIIFINTRNYGGFPEADLYSNFDGDTDFSDLTRIIVTDAQPDGIPLVNTIALIEGLPVGGVERIPYNPLPTEAGYFPGNSYVFFSDTPEPSTLLLIGFGVSALAGVHFRYRSKQRELRRPSVRTNVRR